MLLFRLWIICTYVGLSLSPRDPPPTFQTEARIQPRKVPLFSNLSLCDLGRFTLYAGATKSNEAEVRACPQNMRTISTQAKKQAKSLSSHFLI